MADGRMEGMQRMPRLREARKGAQSREIPARGAKGHRARGTRMGEPAPSSGCTEKSGRTGGTETSKYPEEEKTIVTPRVVASESGKAQTAPVSAGAGL